MTDLANPVGGIIELHYSHTSFGPIYSLRLAVAAFDPTPVGPSNDYAYTGAGGFTPGESGIVATFANLAALWQAYYPATWAVSLTGVYQNVAGTPTPLSVVPTSSPIAGMATGPGPGPNAVKRSVALFSLFQGRWRVWLRQLPPQAVAVTLDVSDTAGGFDARDRAWYAYVTGSQSAIVGRDGTRMRSSGTVRAWYDTPVADYIVSG